MLLCWHVVFHKDIKVYAALYLGANSKECRSALQNELFSSVTSLGGYLQHYQQAHQCGFCFVTASTWSKWRGQSSPWTKKLSSK